MGLSLVQFNVTIDIGMDNEKISKIFGQPGFYEITTHIRNEYNYGNIFYIISKFRMLVLVYILYEV